MTQAPAVQRTASSMSERGVMIAVALVSFSSLLLELAMTRLFSVVLFYHFAFFAISVALLGLGSGGVFAHVRREGLVDFEVRTLCSFRCIADAVFASLAMSVAAALWAGRGKRRSIALAVAAAFAFLIAVNYRGRVIDVVYAKGVLRDPQRIELAKWNAISRIEVDNQNGARYIVI